MIFNQKQFLKKSFDKSCILHFFFCEIGSEETLLEVTTCELCVVQSNSPLRV